MRRNNYNDIYLFHLIHNYSEIKTRKLETESMEKLKNQCRKHI